MKIIGVSGGIGSGKSMVCKIFATLGIPIYVADDRAKWLLNNDELLKNKVIKLLGIESYTPEGMYDRTWVAAQVFNNPTLLQALNAIVHPRVYEDTEEWAKQNANKPYVIKEAALFKKAGEGNNLDFLVVVTAPIELRVARVKQRDPQRSEQEINDIIARQMPDDKRLENADFVILNDEAHLLIPQVLSLHQQFLNSDTTNEDTAN